LLAKYINRQPIFPITLHEGFLLQHYSATFVLLYLF